MSPEASGSVWWRYVRPAPTFPDELVAQASSPANLNGVPPRDQASLGSRSGSWCQVTPAGIPPAIYVGSPAEEMYSHAMRLLRALVIYIAVVFIGGALLAPWLYRLAQSFEHLTPQIANAPFHRFLDRSFLIFALAGLWPVLRSLGAASGSRAERSQHRPQPGECENQKRNGPETGGTERWQSGESNAQTTAQAGKATARAARRR